MILLRLDSRRCTSRRWCFDTRISLDFHQHDVTIVADNDLEWHCYESVSRICLNCNMNANRCEHHRNPRYHWTSNDCLLASNVTDNDWWVHLRCLLRFSLWGHGSEHDIRTTIISIRSNTVTKSCSIFGTFHRIWLHILCVDAQTCASYSSGDRNFGKQIMI